MSRWLRGPASCTWGLFLGCVLVPPEGSATSGPPRGVDSGPETSDSTSSSSSSSTGSPAPLDGSDEDGARDGGGDGGVDGTAPTSSDGGGSSGSDTASADDDGSAPAAPDGPPNLPPFPVAPGDCPVDLTPVGWASIDGGFVDGVAPLEITVRDQATLALFASSDRPTVVTIEGEVTFDEISIGSNTVLQGGSSGAILRGSLTIGGEPGAPVEHVVVRNLRVDAGGTSQEDAIHIEHAQHVWLDHVDVRDAPDGLVDITHGSDLVTVSWSRFSSAPAPGAPRPPLASIIGHDDANGDEDRGHLRVTWHHNHWTGGLLGGMPRIRFGDVHTFNNLYDGPETEHVIRAGFEARVLVERDFFDGVARPHEQFDPSAQIRAVDNVYRNTQGARDDIGQAFAPPYAYITDPALDVQRLVTSCAGPL